MRKTLFVSDLHLDPERPAITALFLDFLAGPAGEAESLFILGDLFEAWVGDDDDSPHNRGVCRALHRCADGGTPVHVMHGNRDFLLGDSFARDCGVTLLDDPTVIDLYGVPTLLMHGDLLCTDDTAYMQFRAMVREPAWQRDMLARPLAERQATAQQMRAASRTENAGKPESIMDVNPATVIDYMSRYEVRQLIHGHTHRPATHAVALPGQPGRRIVLGDWYAQGSVLECSSDGCELHTLPLTPG